MNNFFQILSMIKGHPQPLAFFCLKIFGVKIVKRFFKIDTEGAELFTLKSGMNTFDKTNAFIVGLFNPYTTSRFGYEAIDAAHLLINKGFSNTYRISGSKNLSLRPLDITNKKFDSPDYYLFSKMDIPIEYFESE